MTTKRDLLRQLDGASMLAQVKQSTAEAEAMGQLDTRGLLLSLCDALPKCYRDECFLPATRMPRGGHEEPCVCQEHAGPNDVLRAPFAFALSLSLAHLKATERDDDDEEEDDRP